MILELRKILQNWSDKTAKDAEKLTEDIEKVILYKPVPTPPREWLAIQDDAKEFFIGIALLRGELKHTKHRLEIAEARWGAIPWSVLQRMFMTQNNSYVINDPEFQRALRWLKDNKPGEI